jgi:hypothetical protein
MAQNSRRTAIKPDFSGNYGDRTGLAFWAVHNYTSGRRIKATEPQMELPGEFQVSGISTLFSTAKKQFTSTKVIIFGNRVHHPLVSSPRARVEYDAPRIAVQCGKLFRASAPPPAGKSRFPKILFRKMNRGSCGNPDPWQCGKRAPLEREVHCHFNDAAGADGISDYAQLVA